MTTDPTDLNVLRGVCYVISSVCDIKHDVQLGDPRTCIRHQYVEPTLLPGIIERGGVRVVAYNNSQVVPILRCTTIYALVNQWVHTSSAHCRIRPLLTAHIRFPQKYPDRRENRIIECTYCMLLCMHDICCKSVTNDFLPDGEGSG